MPPSAAPPSPQEVHRKLSVHSVTRTTKPPSVSLEGAVSGTESDSDSVMPSSASAYIGPSSLQQPPLSSIAERGFGSGEDSDEEEEGEGGWRSADIRANASEGVIKSGYLWKKGERRKTWKKRWFVLRTAHLAYYKTSAEYKLLRLLALSDVHSCTAVALKRHENAFGLVSSVRTYYLQAKTPQEVQSWVKAIEDARQMLQATSTQNSSSTPLPIPIPARRSSSNPYPPSNPSPTVRTNVHVLTSSDSEDGSPTNYAPQSASLRDAPAPPLTPRKPQGIAGESGKVILAGYLMKCGSKRRNWRKRWFTLTGEKLVYSGSHMDTKPHRQFLFSQILDALECDLPSARHPPTLSASASTAPSSTSPSSDIDDPYATHTFKIVTTKRTLLLCAPTEEDEIKWLGAVRALISRRSPTSMPGEPVAQGMAPSRSVEGTSGVGSLAGGNAG